MTKRTGDSVIDSDDRPGGLRRRLGSLARQYGIADVYVFGSRAHEIAARVRGSHECSRVPLESDADIAVRPRYDVRFDAGDRVDVTLALEEIFRVPRVDLVVLPEAARSSRSPRFRVSCFIARTPPIKRSTNCTCSGAPETCCPSSASAES